MTNNFVIKYIISNICMFHYIIHIIAIIIFIKYMFLFDYYKIKYILNYCSTYKMVF